VWRAARRRQRPSREPRRRLAISKGDAESAQQPGFDDHAWRALDVPHDWAIEGPFDKSLDPQTGALPHAGIGW
jgi:hypothetical protein